MSFEVLLFGPYADAAGARSVSVEVGSDGTVRAGALLAAVGEQTPALRPLLGGARLAVNSRFAASDDEVSASDEIALVGLVGGG